MPTASTELADEIDASGGMCEPIALDVTDAEQIAAVVDQATEALGTVDILVNNAGIPDAQRAHKMSLELTDAVLDTNVRGPWLLSNEVARRLIAAEAPGRIVNISSMGAFSYNGMGAALYSISKAAIHRMTEVLAVEWARFHINVNCIAPGAFASEMMDGMLSRIGDITKGFPRQRLGDPAQLDSTLLYLVSPASEASPARRSRSTTVKGRALRLSRRREIATSTDRLAGRRCGSTRSRDAVQPDQVAGAEAVALAVERLQLDLAPLDDDDGVAPLVLVVGDGRARPGSSPPGGRSTAARGARGTSRRPLVAVHQRARRCRPMPL